MLLVLVGPPCSGRRSTAQYLAAECGFVFVADTSNALASRKPNSPCDRDRVVTDAICSRPTITTRIGDNASKLLNNSWHTSARVVVIARDGSHAQELRSRPMSVFMSVDAPAMARWHRFNQQNDRTHEPNIHCLYDFLQWSDDVMYGAGLARALPSSSRDDGLHAWMNVSELSIFNDGTRLHLEEMLRALSLRQYNVHARPSWDRYFISLAVLTSKRTNCMKRAVGAVIVRENRVVSTGYNGTASGFLNCNEGGCARCNDFAPRGQSLDVCVCLHAEENAIIEAGAGKCGGAMLYSSVFPCLSCTKQVIQAGIVKVIYNTAYITDDAAERMLLDAGVEVSRCES